MVTWRWHSSSRLNGAHAKSSACCAAGAAATSARRQADGPAAAVCDLRHCSRPLTKEGCCSARWRRRRRAEERAAAFRRSSSHDACRSSTGSSVHGLACHPLSHAVVCAGAAHAGARGSLNVGNVFTQSGARVFRIVNRATLLTSADSFNGAAALDDDARAKLLEDHFIGTFVSKIGDGGGCMVRLGALLLRTA